MAGNSELNGSPVKGQIVRNAAYNGRSWQIRIKSFGEDGEVKYGLKKGFATAEAANERKQEYDKAFEDEARRRGMATSIAADLSVQEYLKYYLEEILCGKCEPSTETVYRYTLYKYILPNWSANMRLDALDDGEINQLLEILGTKSAMEANKAREFLYLAFKHAYYKEKRLSCMPVMKKCPRTAPSVNVLSKQEIKTLLAAAAGGSWYLEILLALFLGLRKGEILGLKFSDFDEESRSVRISRQLAMSATFEKGSYKKDKSEKVEKAPKTSTSVRIIRVPDYVWGEVEKRRLSVEEKKRKLGDKFCDGGYVSCTENGQPRGISSLNVALTKLCDRNGIRHITVHGLRHCYTTILLEQKYELEIISPLLGHSSVNTTYEMYADIIEANEEIKTCLNEMYAMDDEGDEG